MNSFPLHRYNDYYWRCRWSYVWMRTEVRVWKWTSKLVKVTTKEFTCALHEKKIEVSCQVLCAEVFT